MRGVKVRLQKQLFMHFLLMMAKIMVGALIFLVSISEAYINRLRPYGVLIYMEYSRRAMGGVHPIALRLTDLPDLFSCISDVPSRAVPNIRNYRVITSVPLPIKTTSAGLIANRPTVTTPVILLIICSSLIGSIILKL